MLYRFLPIMFLTLCLAVGQSAFADEANNGSNPRSPHASASPEPTVTATANPTPGNGQADTGTGDSADEQVAQLRKDLDKARDALKEFGKKFFETANKTGGVDQAGLQDFKKQIGTLKETIKGLQDRSDHLDESDSNFLSQSDREHLDRLNKIIAKLEEKMKEMDGPNRKEKAQSVQDLFAQFFDSAEVKKAAPPSADDAGQGKGNDRRGQARDEEKPPASDSRVAGETKPSGKSLLDDIGRKAKDLGDWISDKWSSAVDAVGDVWHSAKDAVADAANNLLTPTPETAGALGPPHVVDNESNDRGSISDGEVWFSGETPPAPHIAAAERNALPATTTGGTTGESTTPTRISNYDPTRESGDRSTSGGNAGTVVTTPPVNPRSDVIVADKEEPAPGQGNGVVTNPGGAPLAPPKRLNAIDEDDTLPPVSIYPPSKTGPAAPTVSDKAPSVTAAAPVSAIDLNDTKFWSNASSGDAIPGPAPLVSAAIGVAVSAAAAARAVLVADDPGSTTAPTDTAIVSDVGSLRAGSLYPIRFGVPSASSTVNFFQPPYVSDDSSYSPAPSSNGSSLALATGNEPPPTASITSVPVPEVSRGLASVETDSGWKDLLLGDNGWLASPTGGSDTAERAPDNSAREMGVTGLQVNNTNIVQSSPNVVEATKVNLEMAVASQPGNTYNPPSGVSALLTMVRAPALPPMVVSPSKPEPDTKDDRRALAKKEGVSGMLKELDGDEEEDPTVPVKKKLVPRTTVKGAKERGLPLKRTDVARTT